MSCTSEMYIWACPLQGPKKPWPHLRMIWSCWAASGPDRLGLWGTCNPILASDARAPQGYAMVYKVSCTFAVSQVLDQGLYSHSSISSIQKPYKAGIAALTLQIRKWRLEAQDETVETGRVIMQVHFFLASRPMLTTIFRSTQYICLNGSSRNQDRRPYISSL